MWFRKHLRQIIQLLTLPFDTNQVIYKIVSSVLYSAFLLDPSAFGRSCVHLKIFRPLSSGYGILHVYFLNEVTCQIKTYIICRHKSRTNSVSSPVPVPESAGYLFFLNFYGYVRSSSVQGFCYILL